MSRQDSVQRTITLVASIGVALSSGTNYVYSAYAPQLGQRLGLNHAQLNVIGFAGNAGNYLAGPFWGKAVDTKGPKIILSGGFCCLSLGYLALRMFYNGTLSLPTDTTSLFTPAVAALMFWQFVTGVGGNAGITAGLNGTAKSFPDTSRATVTGLVVSGFGLSAFLFSTIAHIFFPGNTSDFLLLLAIGTSLPHLLGAVFIKVVPHAPHAGHVDPIPATGGDSAVEVFSPIIGPQAYDRLDNYSTDELGANSSGIRRSTSDTSVGRPLMDRLSRTFRSSSKPGSPTSRRNSHPLQSSYDGDESDQEEGEELSESRHGLLSGKKRVNVTVTHPDVYGFRLLTTTDFWVIFSILSLLSGTGLMYINNVGSICQALFIKANGAWDELEGSKIQSTQVSLTSLGNCAGRILVGLSADFFHSRTGSPRVYLCTAISLLFLLSQLLLMSIDTVDSLWMSSISVGMTYGATFGLLPVITIEWFGLQHFSQNWGFVSMAPVFAGNVFSLAFGKNYDAHAAQPSTPLEPRGGLPTELLCYQGRICYVDSLKITAGACSLAAIISLYAAFVDHRRQREKRVVEVWSAEPEET